MGISVSAALCPTGSQGVAAALPACLLGQSAHKLSSCWQRRHGAVERILGRQPGGKSESFIDHPQNIYREQSFEALA